MADIASPAPAVSTPAAPANGAAPPPPAPRSNSGQFSPKDGATGVTPPEKKPGQPPAPPAEKKPEPYRFKRKLPQRGDVDLDEDGLSRELDELAWRRKQQAEVTAMKREADELVKLAQTDRSAFFKKLGVDLDAAAEERAAERQRLAQMTPEQQELEQARQELARGKKALEAEQQKLREQALAGERAKHQAQNRADYEAALGHSVLPHSRAKLFLMTQIQKGQKESGAPKLTPEQLGKAYDEMMFTAFDEMVNAASTKPEALGRWPGLPKLAVSALSKLEGAQLLELLGPAIQRRVLEASVAAHRGQQTIPVRRQETPSGAPPPTAPSTGPIDEVQLEQRKRDFMKTFHG